MARKQTFSESSTRISVVVPLRLDTALRVEAAKRRIPPSAMLAQILEQALGGNTLEAIQPVRPIGRPLKTPKASNQASSEPIDPGPNAWSYQKLSDVLNKLFPQGGGHRKLAAALGVTNVSPWAKTGVPKKWWPGINDFLAIHGWTPEEIQPSLL